MCKKCKPKTHTMNVNRFAAQGAVHPRSRELQTNSSLQYRVGWV